MRETKMDDWKYNAELSQALGSKEWISAEIRTRAKAYCFSASDFNFDKKGPIAADIEVCADLLPEIALDLR